MVEYFFIKFGDSSCSGFWDVRINRQRDTHTNVGENPTPPLEDTFGEYFSQDTFYQNNLINDNMFYSLL